MNVATLQVLVVTLCGALLRLVGASYIGVARLQNEIAPKKS